MLLEQAPGAVTEQLVVRDLDAERAVFPLLVLVDFLRRNERCRLVRSLGREDVLQADILESVLFSDVVVCPWRSQSGAVDGPVD